MKSLGLSMKMAAWWRRRMAMIRLVSMPSFILRPSSEVSLMMKSKKLRSDSSSSQYSPLFGEAWIAAWSRIAMPSGSAGEKKMAKPSINDIARIFEDVGGYYVSPESEDYLDTRGKAYPTKSEAQRAAARAGYTHMVGSGTPA